MIICKTLQNYIEKKNSTHPFFFTPENFFLYPFVTKTFQIFVEKNQARCNVPEKHSPFFSQIKICSLFKKKKKTRKKWRDGRFCIKNSYFTFPSCSSFDFREKRVFSNMIKVCTRRLNIYFFLNVIWKKYESKKRSIEHFIYFFFSYLFFKKG